MKQSDNMTDTKDIVVLGFDIWEFDYNELLSMKDNELYTIAKENTDKGTTRICTLLDFFGRLNGDWVDTDSFNFLPVVIKDFFR